MENARTEPDSSGTDPPAMTYQQWVVEQNAKRQQWAADRQAALDLQIAANQLIANPQSQNPQPKNPQPQNPQPKNLQPQNP